MEIKKFSCKFNFHIKYNKSLINKLELDLK